MFHSIDIETNVIYVDRSVYRTEQRALANRQTRYPRSYQGTCIGTGRYHSFPRSSSSSSSSYDMDHMDHMDGWMDGECYLYSDVAWFHRIYLLMHFHWNTVWVGSDNPSFVLVPIYSI